ncbi:MAG: response regulator transcription factor [Pleurocapsa sp. MO_192.B19]|nr:response regulator transcription factor [Pleurocapsa sp. MO_192.B19]
MIKILIVDDQNFTRQALRVILETEVDFELVGQATNGIEAFEYLEKTDVDVTIVDLEMPGMDGLTVTKMLGERFPNTKVVILSTHDDEENINAAVEAGARGYLLKSTSAKEIVDTIRAVQRGYFQLGPGLFEKLLSRLINDKEQASENLSQLENNYIQTMNNLEKKILLRHEAERQELYQEMELQINNLKQDFRNGLENFQHQVSQQLQSGLEAANIRFQDSMPNTHEIEMQIDSRNLDQQRYINTLFAGNKQSIKKLEHQINSMRYFVIFLSIVFVTVSMLLLY